MAIETIKTGRLTWVNMTTAGKKEINYLARNFKFHHLDLEDSYASHYAQRPKIVEHPDYLFFILLFPYYSRRDREIRSAEIDFFVTPTHLITVHNEELAPLVNFFNHAKIDNKEKAKYLGGAPSKLLYEILNQLLLECFPMLDHISIDIGNVQRKIFSGFEKQMMREILVIKRNIINFRNAMHEHKKTIRKIIANNSRHFPGEELALYYDNLVDQAKNIWDILENQKDTIAALEDTNNALVSFRLNVVMKTLTVFFVIAFPLTFFAAIFGMNTVAMPIIGWPYDFWIVLGLMALTSAIIALVLKKKRWL
jgi:magnesium transporter